VSGWVMADDDLGELARRVWAESVQRKMLEKAQETASKAELPNDPYGDGRISVPGHRGPDGHLAQPRAAAPGKTPLAHSPTGAELQEYHSHRRDDIARGKAPQPKPEPHGSATRKQSDVDRQEAEYQRGSPSPPQHWLDAYMGRPHMRDDAPLWLGKYMDDEDRP